MSCVDTNPATEALAKILHELIDLGEGGNDLREAALEVVRLFRCADIDFGRWTLEKLDLLRVDQDSAKDLYLALRKISKLSAWNATDGNEAFHTAVKIANDAMKKARCEE